MTTHNGNIVIELEGYTSFPGRDGGRRRKEVRALGKVIKYSGRNPYEDTVTVRENDRIQLKPGEHIKLKLKDVTGVFYQLWLYREPQGEEKPGKTGELHKCPIGKDRVDKPIFDGDVHLLMEPNSITITHRGENEGDSGQAEHAHFRFSVFFEIDNIRYVWDPDVHDLGGGG